jgi:hypothetical protein
VDLLEDGATFPETTLLEEEIDKYLYHFQWMDTEEKVLNSTRTYTDIVAYCWIDIPTLRRSIRFPEVLQCDDTCKTNDQNFYLNYVLGADSDNKTVMFLNSLVSNKSQFTYEAVFCTVLGVVYGRYLQATNVIIVDGNAELEKAFDIAITSGSIGSTSTTFRKSCFFHAVTQAYRVHYHVGGTDSYTFDGKVGETAMLLLKAAFFALETLPQLDEAWNEIMMLVNKTKTGFTYVEQYNEIRRQSLNDFLGKVWGKRKVLSYAHTPQRITTLRQMTTSRTEAENWSAKRNGHIHNRATLEKVLVAETQRASVSEIGKQRKDYEHGSKARVALVNTEKQELLHLTPYAIDEVKKQIYKSESCSVTRTAASSFTVDTHTVCIVHDDTRNLVLQCSCRYQRNMLLPCRHTLSVNHGLFQAHDAHPRWTHHFKSGKLDNLLLPRSVRDIDLYGGPSLAFKLQDLDAIYPIASMDEHVHESGHTDENLGYTDGMHAAAEILVDSLYEEGVVSGEVSDAFNGDPLSVLNCLDLHDLAKYKSTGALYTMAMAVSSNLRERCSNNKEMLVFLLQQQQIMYRSILAKQNTIATNVFQTPASGDDFGGARDSNKLPVYGKSSFKRTKSRGDPGHTPQSSKKMRK